MSWPLHSKCGAVCCSELQWVAVSCSVFEKENMFSDTWLILPQVLLIERVSQLKELLGCMVLTNEKVSMKSLNWGKLQCLSIERDRASQLRDRSSPLRPTPIERVSQLREFSWCILGDTPWNLSIERDSNWKSEDSNRKSLSVQRDKSLSIERESLSIERDSNWESLHGVISESLHGVLRESLHGVSQLRETPIERVSRLRKRVSQLRKTPIERVFQLR